MTKSKRVDNEAAVLRAIGGWVAEGFGPSFRDLADITGLPLGTVHEVARDLRAQGKLMFVDRIARSLRLPSE